MTDLVAGTPINEWLELERELGEGGMGKIWVAIDRGSGARYVVKLLAPELVGDEQNRVRFEREAEAAQQVDSPYVVRTYGHGIAPGGAPYIAMELLHGRDLGKLLEEQKRLPAAMVATIMAQTAHALGRAHDVGIVHRDIKPENIFLQDVPGGGVSVKLLDFGLAVGTQQKVRMTSTGMLVGTPYYWSPEQSLSARSADHRSDLWSLGVVAFQALTGRLPFEMSNFAALTLAIHSAPVPVPSTLVAELSPAIDAWIAKALTRDPAGRFQTAEAFAQGLAYAIAAVGHAPPATPEQGRVVVTPPPMQAYLPAVAAGPMTPMKTIVTGRSPSSPDVVASPSSPSSPPLPAAARHSPVPPSASASTPAPSTKKRSARPPLAALVVIVLSVGVIAYLLGQSGKRSEAKPPAASSVR
jgi:serine/threonine-protein kinase